LLLLTGCADTGEMDASERRPYQPLPQTASPFQAATTGTLVFQSDVAGRPKIFTVDVATGQVRQITQGTEWRDESPRWSPDGQSIAFTSNRAHYGATPEAGTPDLDVHVMRADGSQVRRITTDPGNDHDPSWLPDGQSLVFSSDRASRGDLYRVRLSDGHTTRLTTNFVGRAIMPAVSPDGAKVAFAAQTLRVGAFWNFQVHLLDLASGRTEPVPASGGACWPAWSPDGRVLYSVQLDSEPSAIQRRDLSNGAVQVAHASETLWSYYPRVSPDGQWLALSVSPEHHDGENWDLALVSTADSSRRIPLTTGPGNDRLPDWRPR
jgi:Tol biopolymer transport system component